MDLSGCGGKLNLATKVMLQRWEEAQSKWNDPVSKVYDDEHLAPLADQVRATLRAIDRLGIVLRQAQTDCS